MNINEKIRQIAKDKENQRQSFICKGKREAKLSLPYSKYPELIAIGGGDTSYNTTYTLDENGRVSSITYRFPEEVRSLPIISNLGTDINIEFDNFNPSGPVPSSQYPFNYLNSPNIKRVWLGNETLSKGNFQYPYVIAPNLKLIDDVGTFGNNAPVGEFPELEEFDGRNFYQQTPSTRIDESNFSKLHTIRRRYGTERCFESPSIEYIRLPFLERAPTYFGGTGLLECYLPAMGPNIPGSFMPNAKNVNFLQLGKITRSDIMPNHSNPFQCIIVVDEGSSQSAISGLESRGFAVIVSGGDF